MTIGEIGLAGKQGGPKRQYADRLYNPTPEQIHNRCMEKLEEHDAQEKAKAKAKGKAKGKNKGDTPVTDAKA